jgi:hypothetical protein
MTTPSPGRPDHGGETITESRATIVTIDAGDNKALPPRLLNRPRPKPAAPPIDQTNPGQPDKPAE